VPLAGGPPFPQSLCYLFYVKTVSAIANGDAQFLCVYGFMYALKFTASLRGEFNALLPFCGHFEIDGYCAGAGLVYKP
jgi:hypothetical protein